VRCYRPVHTKRLSLPSIDAVAILLSFLVLSALFSTELQLEQSPLKRTFWGKTGAGKFVK